MKKIYETIYAIRHRLERMQYFVNFKFKSALQNVIDLLNKLVTQLEAKEKEWENSKKSGDKEKTS